MTEPSAAAWRRSSDIAARILENLAERDASLVPGESIPRARLRSRWLSPQMVCEVWPGMTVTKLQRMRDEGRGPAYSKVGKTITYDMDDVDEFIARHRVGTREQA